MESVNIGNVHADRWEEFRDLRIKGLTEEYKSFARTPEEESKRTEQEWRARCSNRLDSNLREWLLAEDAGKLIGCVMVSVGEPQKVRHVGHIGGMFVLPEYREKGIATALLNSGLSKMKANGATKARLEVISTQDPAVNLYKKLGFETIGIFKKEINAKNEFLDELVMEKTLLS